MKKIVKIYKWCYIGKRDIQIGSYTRNLSFKEIWNKFYDKIFS